MSRWTALLSVLVSSSAFAGTYNFRPIMIGERAVCLGGAYTALSDSAEGGFYNPAGLAFVTDTTLSVAGNFYSLNRGERKNALQFAGDTADLPQDSFNSIPQVAAFAKNIRLPWDPAVVDHPLNTMALTIAVAEQVDLSGRVDFDVATGHALLTRSITDRTLYVGPSFARRLSDRLSWGVSMFYVLRLFDSTGFILQDTSTVLGQGFRKESQTTGGLVGLAGVRYGVWENLWLGLSYQTAALKVHTSGSTYSAVLAQDKVADTTDSSETDQKDLEPNNPIPHRLAFGVAYQKPKRWTLSGDALIHFPNDYYPYSDVATPPLTQHLVVNFSVGGEYYITPMVPIRAGVFSDFSAASDIKPSTTGQADKVDAFGFTVGSGVEQKNTSISMGATITLGNGQGVDNRGNPIDITNRSYALFLAGSYKF